MQTFYEHLQENDSPLDSLGHDMPMSPKRKKQLEADRGIFKDFPVQQWTEYHPYKNSSVLLVNIQKLFVFYVVVNIKINF